MTQRQPFLEFSPRPHFNAWPAVRQALREAPAWSRLSRAQVVDRCNALAEAEGVRMTGGNTGGRLTENTLEKWLAPGEARVPSLGALLILCAVLETIAPVQALVAPLGLFVIGPEDQRRLELAKAREQKRMLDRKIRKLEEEIRRG
ncbi:MAG: hypothetical protein JRI97_12495 [Deltaproteobacteria bacterium]|nr:hypothetical protein [Deltaproteobacteria bacterium]